MNKELVINPVFVEFLFSGFPNKFFSEKNLIEEKTDFYLIGEDFNHIPDYF